MKKDKTLIRIISLSVFIVVLIFIFLYRGLLKYEAKSIFGPNKKAKAACANCDKYFRDNVKTHEIAYTGKEGISPQKDLSDLERLKNKKVLMEITTNENYIVRKMDHSKPYVKPKVVKFLDNLVDNYKLELNGLNYIPFEISSATRSKRSVRDLMGDNVNSVSNSAHLKGKTIDISYVAYGNNTQQLTCLVNALQKLHEVKRCFVKYEVAQGCLHITVR